MSNHLQNRLSLFAVLLLTAISSAAQVQLGSNLHMTASGNVSAGYSADYGDQTSSAHSLDIGGDGTLSGYYYAPSLLSFNVLPYYNQSRANSNYQSISGSSGAAGSATFFANSHFPGAISYSRTYDSTGTYGLAGTPNFTTQGNGQGYSIGWSALLPNLPTLSVGYMAGSGSSNVYGSDARSTSSTHNLNIRSTYLLAGFRLNATYSNGGAHGDIPSFLTGATDEISDSTNHSESISAEHRLPLRGTWSATYSRSGYSSGYIGASNSDSTTDSVVSNALLRPTPKLTLSLGTTYSDNLEGALNQEILSTGGSPVNTNIGATSHSTSVNAGAGYTIAQNMGVQAVVTHQQQYFGGASYGATFVSGTLYYNRRLLDMFTFSVTALDSAADGGSNAVGIQGNVNFSKRMAGWETSATASYGQNVQTLLITYTTSYFNYSASTRRRLTRHLTSNSNFSGTHSGFSQQLGNTNHSESYSSGLSYRVYNINGGYSSSRGLSVLTSNGLSTTGLTPVVSPQDQIVFDATSYNFSASASPSKRLTIAANYAKSTSSTNSSSISSLNRTTSLNSQLQYRVRRLGIMAGYTRFSQGISAGGAPAAAVTSYYFGINRWINLF